MRKEIRQNALAQKVLAVAVLKYDNEVLFDWAVYIDAVPGISHNAEAERVVGDGCKQPQRIAEVLFPDVDITKYSR